MHKGVLRNCLEVVEPRANAVKKAWVLWASRESLQSRAESKTIQRYRHAWQGPKFSAACVRWYPRQKEE